MPVLVTSNFDDDSIKNERASMETAVSHNKSMGKFLDAQGQQLHSQWLDLAEIQTCPRFYACPRYLQVYKGSDRKQLRKEGDIIFPIISQWGLSVAMKTRVLIQSATKPYAAFPPTPVMLHIKFDQDWQTGFKDIKV